MRPHELIRIYFTNLLDTKYEGRVQYKLYDRENQGYLHAAVKWSPEPAVENDDDFDCSWCFQDEVIYLDSIPEHYPLADILVADPNCYKEIEEIVDRCVMVTLAQNST
jgi:hypothetical protein